MSRTGHDARFANQFSEFDLAANIPVSYVEVGLGAKHPILSLDDIIKTLDKENKLQDIMMQGNSAETFKHFWSNWRQLQPTHGIFQHHNTHLGQCIPVAVHCDEGTTLKKKNLMVIQLQPLVGRGTRKKKGTPEIPGCNMLGNSLTSRLLWSVMLGRAYTGKKLKNKPLLNLISHLASQLTDAFYNGIPLKNGTQLFLIPLACKGDWPALVKIGSLNRHFQRVSYSTKTPPPGLCHLCKADQQHHKDWHDVSWDNMVKMKQGSALPWVKDPSLVLAVPTPNCYKAQFFRVDLFHTLHKGVMGDIAANAIVLWNSIVYFLGFF